MIFSSASHGPRTHPHPPPGGPRARTLPTPRVAPRSTHAQAPSTPTTRTAGSSNPANPGATPSPASMYDSHCPHPRRSPSCPSRRCSCSPPRAPDVPSHRTTSPALHGRCSCSAWAPTRPSTAASTANTTTHARAADIPANPVPPRRSRNRELILNKPPSKR